jgi:tyrosyl-tRNA synthetase
VRWQSEWYGDFDLARALDLAGRFTLGQLLRHETFRRRYEAGAPLTMLELLYPILQGYDSVAVEADVELGGTDQRFNMLAGRELMAQLGMLPQDVLMVPLIPGLDGRKMSKSFGNTIDVRAAPLEMYSRTMAMRDEAVPLLVETLTDLPLEDAARAAAEPGGALALKHRLAREVVAQIYGERAAGQAAEAWARQFSRREEPEEMPEHPITAPATVVDLLVGAGLAASRSEARRLVDGGGVRLDGERVEAYGAMVGPERPAVLQVGRRRFVRVVGVGGPA